MYVENVSPIPWFVENPVSILKWPIKSRMRCLVPVFAKFLGYIYLSEPETSNYVSKSTFW